MRQRVPFTLLGFDTDNDSVLMNETVKTYREEAGLVFTRCRPYRKNDQAWVEQKNGAVVRRAVGYRRYEGRRRWPRWLAPHIVAVVREFFQPSFKLAGKARDGAKIKKTYPPARHALSASAGGHANQRGREEPGERDLCGPGPGSSLREIRSTQGHLVEIADRPVTGEADPPTAPTIEQFLSGLRTAWRDGEADRPISRRRRPGVAGVVPTRSSQ